MDDILTKQLGEWIASTLIAALAGSGCLMTGCTAAGPKDFNDAMALVDKVKEVAAETGAAAVVTVTWTGNPGFVEEAAIRFDTGLTAQVSFMVNGACAPGQDEPDVPPVP